MPRKNHPNLTKALQDSELPKLDDEPIKKILGDSTPRLHLTKAGRLRLVSALSYKYGENFRNFESAHEALKHFDDNHDLLKQYLKVKGYVRG